MFPNGQLLLVEVNKVKRNISDTIFPRKIFHGTVGTVHLSLLCRFPWID